MRLLIVEDNTELAEALRSAFSRREIAVDHAISAVDAELLLRGISYAAMILDLGLPDDDGLNLLAWVREREDPIPVLILTARSSVEDRIRGLNAGADDYLVKPFDFDELQARLDAILRRKGGYSSRTLLAGNVSFDIVTREVLIGEDQIRLSARETDLLELLLRRPGHVVPKRMAEDQLFGSSESLGSNAIEVYAHRLRRRLETNGAKVRIDTIRGVGYMLRPAE